MLLHLGFHSNFIMFIIYFKEKHDHLRISHKFGMIVHDLESFSESCYSGRYSTEEMLFKNTYISIKISIRGQKKSHF